MQFVEPRPQKIEILTQLELIFQSKEFASSERLKRFLHYVVEETLAGRGEQIKAYSVGVNVFDLDEDFDPALNPSIRVTACRLRSKLEHYYFTSLNDDKVDILIPRGTYLPAFSYRKQAGGGTFANGRGDPPVCAEELADPEADLPNAAAQATPTRPAILVLPFTDLSGQPDIAHFLEGLAEEISIALVKFDSLMVLGIQRYQTQNQEAWEIGAKSGARFVITGSAQLAGAENDNLRIRIHLFDTQTRTCVWSQKFEGNINNTSLFQLQDEITGQVSARIADSFGLINRVLLREQAEKSSADLEVYEAMLYYHHWLFSLSNERFIKVKTALERAVSLDPAHAATKAMLSDVYASHYQWGLNIFPEALELSKELANQALELDANCQYAHWAAAYNHYLRRDKQNFLDAVYRALEINPSNTNILATSGTKIVMTGNWDEGLEMLNTARRLNPHTPCWYHCAPFIVHYIHEEYEAALREAMQITTPNFMWGNILRMAAYACLGDYGNAGAEAEKLLQIAPEFPKHGYDYLLTMFFEKSSADKVSQGLKRAGIKLITP